MAKQASARQVATAYFDAIAARDLDALGACWAPNGVDRLYGMAELVGPDGVRDYFAGVFASFPDFAIKVEDVVAYRDKAAVRWSATGTFTGPARFEGLAPTGAAIRLEGLDLLTVEDGLIRENHAFTNAAELARQLGAMPPAGSLGERAMIGAVNARTAALGLARSLAERRARG